MRNREAIPMGAIIVAILGHVISPALTSGLAVCFVSAALTSALAAQQAAPPPTEPGIESRPAEEVADVPATPLHMTRPKYPKAAFAKRIQGAVVVEFQIDVQGRVAGARVVESIPDLDAAALACVSKWRFKPAQKAGKPIATFARVPILFRIH